MYVYLYKLTVLKIDFRLNSFKEIMSTSENVPKNIAKKFTIFWWLKNFQPPEFSKF